MEPKRCEHCGAYYRSYKHGETVGRGKTSLYRRWQAMKDRCENELNKSYKNYGGRGIAVCDEWYDFARFREWAFVSGYKGNLLLDRINNDGPYSPDNCRWVTRAISNVNKRQKYRPIVVDGVEGSYAFWAKRLGCDPAIIRVRINTLKWSEKDAVTVPVLPRGKMKGKRA